MKCNALIFVLLIILPLKASAYFSAYGTGIEDLSCARFAEEVYKVPINNDFFGWWLAGFVTGVNLEKQRTLTTDMTALKTWIIKYCENHPLDTVMKAAIELNKELENRVN